MGGFKLKGRGLGSGAQGFREVLRLLLFRV